MKRRIIIALAVAAAAVVGWNHVVYDATGDRPATCEVHGIRMGTHLVPMRYGMKAVTKLSVARRHSFPHSDEPYESGFCAESHESYAMVLICPQCTVARHSWWTTNTTMSVNLPPE